MPLIPRATYQPGDAAREAKLKLFGPEPDCDMALEFIEMCREVGWTVEDSLALARQIQCQESEKPT